MGALRRWRRLRAARVRWATHVPGCPQRPAFVPLRAIGARGGATWMQVAHPPWVCHLDGCDRLVPYAVCGTTRALELGVGIRTQPHGHVYCSVAHRDLNEIRHQQPRAVRELRPSTPPKRMLAPEPCPHPEKKAFETRTVAERYFTDLLRADPLLQVYQCRCWRFHAGHPTEVPDEPIDIAPPADLSSDYALGAIARITRRKEQP